MSDARAKYLAFRAIEEELSDDEEIEAGHLIVTLTADRDRYRTVLEEIAEEPCERYLEPNVNLKQTVPCNGYEPREKWCNSCIATEALKEN